MTARRVALAILSDVHYAGPGEQSRPDYCLNAIAHPARRALTRFYRHHVWQRDPFAHNHLLEQFLRRVSRVDWVVANGDYSCDSAFVGVADAAARESARLCLGKLRAAFPARLAATLGDHELGKKPLGADRGGMRFESLDRAVRELELQPFWRIRVGRYVLMGVTSSLIALPVFEPETLVAERPAWHRARAEHLHEIADAFAALGGDERVLLFCHDPTALPFLLELPAVRARLHAIECTIIGHLHSPVVLWKARLLAGLPPVRFLGHTVRRLSSALCRARAWDRFRILLCPSLSGIQLLKDGGFYTAALDREAREPVQFEFHRLPWR
ncbi:MAG TPA: hypothetical protein VNO52_14270 [Methylomirabilota bacterium]|nr:hypothetical protein [Methylomirabilota bacterium]